MKQYYDLPDNWKTLSVGIKYQSNILKAIVKDHCTDRVIKTVLDAASGVGTFANFVHEIIPDPKYILLDISESSLLRSILNERIVGDAHNLPIKKNSIDLILCRQGLHYMRINQVISEFQRVLSQDGILIISNEWWLEEDETAEEILWINELARSRGKPDHNILSRNTLIDSLYTHYFQIIHRSDNFDTYTMPIKEWLYVYDTPNHRFSKIRKKLLSQSPNRSLQKGYPSERNGIVQYISKWIVLVARKEQR
jgi:ubiquinone/menaquinone biosynthesis C-methylase UbiE